MKKNKRVNNNPVFRIVNHFIPFIARMEIATEISKRQLIRIEQGKANLAAHILYKLADIPEIDIKELFEG
ncbi:MAG TPA: helix-turn-helix transcriptional regulator [Bacteroidia bacterium]|nr:helix-turn-helix transcriptional regulator [Bacteroidia bacterium]